MSKWIGMFVKAAGWLICAGVGASVLAGCGGSPSTADMTSNMGAMSAVTARTASDSARPAPPPPVRKVTNRKPDLTGTVFIPMFHHLGDSKNPNFCTPKQFLGWLTKFDQLGFRPVTAKEYLENKMDLPEGASPVVFTFDDSNPDQLQLDSKGNVTPDCFVGIWMKFAKSHPEFPVKATFFVLPVFFGQSAMRQQKYDLLTRLGCEIANHTTTHPDLGRLNDNQVKEEIGQAQIRLEKMGVQAPIPLAVPYGVRPRNHALLKGFKYGKEEIKPLGVFMAGASPAFSPISKHFDRYHIPRIIANGSDKLGLNHWLKRVESGKEELYVAGPPKSKDSASASAGRQSLLGN